MPEPRHWHLVMYDVSDANALRRVHKLLRAWGKALQFSLFRVRCTARELERLRFELSKLLSDTDRLLIARLCNSCASRIHVRGETMEPFDLDVPTCHVV